MRKSTILPILAVLAATPLATAFTQTNSANGQVDPDSAKVDALFAQSEKSDSPRLDGHGVALPPGALNRLGSQRFRNNDTVGALVFEPDGKAIASACADGSVRLWDAATGKLRWRLEADKKQDAFPVKLKYI